MSKIHLIGVCGTAMATLAAMLKRKGHDVQGSDQDVYPPMSDFLATEGIRTLTGYTADPLKVGRFQSAATDAQNRWLATLLGQVDSVAGYSSAPVWVESKNSVAHSFGAHWSAQLGSISGLGTLGAELTL